MKNRRQGSDPQCLLCCISATREQTLKKQLLRYVTVTEDMSTVFEMCDSNDRREQLVKRLEVYPDSDWASDQTSQKSTSGAVIMVEGMRLHAHSRR